jgi:hypothetical protein
MFKPFNKVLLILLLFTTLLALLGAAPKPGYKFVGNKTSQKHRFHTFTCDFAKEISDEHAIYFKSKEDAVKQGYTPCKVCKP